MKTAKSWKVKIKGEERSIELFDENGEKIVGAARWEGDFDCSHQNLTSLEGAPKEVGGGFYCDNNKLTSLKGAPKEYSKNVLQTLFIKHLKRDYVYYNRQIVKLSQFYKDEHDYPKEFVKKVKRSLRQINFEEQLQNIINYD